MHEEYKERAGFVSSEKVEINDKVTGKKSVLYKTHFVLGGKLLTYWLQNEVKIDADLPQCDILLEKRISNEGKFELKVKDVILI